MARRNVKPEHLEVGSIIKWGANPNWYRLMMKPRYDAKAGAWRVKCLQMVHSHEGGLIGNTYNSPAGFHIPIGRNGFVQAMEP